VKKSKRWCKTKYCRDIWDKFDCEEDKNKRVYLPEFKMFNDDLEYLRVSALRHGVSRGCQFEKMVERVFSRGLLSFDVVLLKPNGAKRKSPNFNTENSKKRPKLKIHPAYIEMLKREAKRKEICISLLTHKLFFVYRERFPIYLKAARTN